MPKDNDQHHSSDLSPAQAQEYLSGMEYPADKDELLDCARDNGADQHVMSFLERIPSREYDSPTEVSEAIGQLDHQADSAGNHSHQEKDADNEDKAAF